MERRPYPVDRKTGMPLRIEEVELAPSRLDPYDRYAYGNHHYHYNAPWYRKDQIFNSLRNLQREQVGMPKDQHNIGRLALHMVYGQPEIRPTHKQAMNRLEEGFETEERFKVWNTKTRRYEYEEFTEEYWNALQEVYNSYDKN